MLRTPCFAACAAATAAADAAAGGGPEKLVVLMEGEALLNDASGGWGLG